MGVAQTIGRYFSVISVIPSALYIAFVYLLIASGSWRHSPDWGHAFESFEHISIGGIGAIVFLSIGLGLFMHPIQFSVVQFFEGYWGTGKVAQAIRARRIMHYRRMYDDLAAKSTAASSELDRLRKARIDAPFRKVQLISLDEEAKRAINYLPLRRDHVMPTRLGNMLRRYESLAGSQYHMAALQVVPHIILIAPENQVDYVNDQRSQLDLAVRMTFISIIASATAVLFLWPYGLWVLVALIPYVLAYLSYRGSIVAGFHYGSAFDTLINLNRFALYEQLRLPLPVDTEAERLTNDEMKGLFGYSPAVVTYKHPDGASGTEAPPQLPAPDDDQGCEIPQALSGRPGLDPRCPWQRRLHETCGDLLSTPGTV